jgi:hypothetical protein
MKNNHSTQTLFQNPEEQEKTRKYRRYRTHNEQTTNVKKTEKTLNFENVSKNQKIPKNLKESFSEITL